MSTGPRAALNPFVETLPSRARPSAPSPRLPRAMWVLPSSPSSATSSRARVASVPAATVIRAAAYDPFDGLCPPV